MYPVNYIGPVQHDISIHCMFTGNSFQFLYPDYWLHSGKYIDNNTRQISTINKPTTNNCTFIFTLTIKNTTSRDSGDYMCIGALSDSTAMGIPRNTTAGMT